jgi:uncharacterized pyridoxamine 5'-phosphate oxidase family protein
MSWSELENGNKELAEFGRSRFASRVAYLATIRKDGSPRVHPLTPIIGEGHLLVGMEPTSPKGFDLRRDGRYALHCSVEDDDGGGGEFFISGRAQFSDDPELRAVALKHSPYKFADRYVLFELQVESAQSTTYTEDGPVHRRWKMS